jgi:VWFA-related protein
MRLRICTFAGVAALGLVGLRGQQVPVGSALQEDAPALFRIDAHLVVCHTTVVDKAGHLVTNLRQNAFSVYENNVRQEIKVFKHEDIPVSMGLVIDNSGSMAKKRGAVEAAALALVKDSNPDDEVFVVNFNEDAYLDNPGGKEFLTDIEDMKAALTRIDSRGETAMRNAIQMSIEWLKKSHKDKKVLVVVTDGEDNASDEEHNSLEKVVRSARQSEVLVYTVGLLSEEDKRAAASARRQLTALSDATGGETYFPKDVSEVDRIAHQVARDIRGQYTLEYTPANAKMDGTFRKIRVSVKAPGNPTPRTRTGYYATPNQGGEPAVATSSFRR